MHDLNTLIDQRDPLVLTSAFAINLSDAILAEGAYNGEAVQVQNPGMGFAIDFWVDGH